MAEGGSKDDEGGAEARAARAAPRKKRARVALRAPAVKRAVDW
jgi:hypothetical protein